ncbi:ribonuclease H family protein [Lapidilactobacillus gannanensis]|jgi:ribonuclease HI|uniref:ribonuclease H n=1 Tax=Lapidilactobacillus gannanensis TaxID=2486002 RepID=A0ABW4BM10_9LACO|nr:ribonuclease H family protein [Lapidilactobacillus gannanensis]MCH4057860.1 ribonuclease H family protein [Lactobacillaceae bacterium]
MSKNNFYAVAHGRQPGIYRDWPTAEKQIAGFPKARYHGFVTEAEAQKWLAEMTVQFQRVGQISAMKKQPINHQPVKKATPQITISADAIQVYTDGGSRNTGNVRGGHVRQDDFAAWAYLIVLPTGQQLSDTAGEKGATNNKMELTAFAAALTKLIALGQQKAKIQLTSDSRYILDAIQKNWLAGWQRRNWRKATGEPIANPELWQQISRLLPQFEQLQLIWAKGHATNQGNIFVDELLNKTMDQMA